jgi:hypothetical protein
LEHGFKASGGSRSPGKDGGPVQTETEIRALMDQLMIEVLRKLANSPSFDALTIEELRKIANSGD